MLKGLPYLVIVYVQVGVNQDIAHPGRRGEPLHQLGGKPERLAKSRKDAFVSSGILGPSSAIR